MRIALAKMLSAALDADVMTVGNATRAAMLMDSNCPTTSWSGFRAVKVRRVPLQLHQPSHPTLCG